ncbi:hypothetical protein IEN85_04910 [Pelagicoccus sp. NFK12]|uniref:Uncharacterized protein n=1 Tax=Pelagicoccus enzymogenes TaxID=2773457 RepID=A0A927F7T9_9BACT|nr:hypothetical protein [Pelagicoccus enzymogenes]MBD5778821.1 hypothetical protein [Pelagicoccus enzymogenes]
MKLYLPLKTAFSVIGLFLAAAVALDAAPAGLTEKEAKKFDRAVKSYYRKSSVENDRNDAAMTWVQTPQVENEVRDTYYHLRAAVKNGRALVFQIVAQKDYLTTSQIYDPNASKWNSAVSEGNALLLESSVATNPRKGTPVQYGFVKLSEPFLRKCKDTGFTVTVKHVEEGDETDFEVEPELVTAFLKKYDEATQ